MQVQTQTQKILLVRKMVLELLLARCPDSEVIQKMAARMGVEKPRFRLDEGNWKCILCGLCVKTCEEAVGVSAIGLSYRGSIKKVGTPFVEPTMVCIGCGACHFVCPTGAIKMTEEERHAENLGAGLQASGLQSLRLLLCARVSVGVDVQKKRCAPGIFPDLPELPEINLFGWQSRDLPKMKQGTCGLRGNPDPGRGIFIPLRGGGLGWGGKGHRG